MTHKLLSTDFHCNSLPPTHWLNTLLIIISHKDYWLILSLTVKEMVNWSIILSITKPKKIEIPIKGSTVLPFINQETTFRYQFPANTTLGCVVIRCRFSCCSSLQLQCFPLQTHLSCGTWPMILAFSHQWNTSYFWESWCLHMLFFPWCCHASMIALLSRGGNNNSDLL